MYEGEIKKEQVELEKELTGNLLEDRNIWKLLLRYDELLPEEDRRHRVSLLYGTVKNRIQQVERSLEIYEEYYKIFNEELVEEIKTNK
jgi:lipase chaperone LimK